jgi:DNA (cytosine-5)-methyltransferase 1
MKHIDLFSGIGGFAYAVDQVWDNVEHIFCEINPFCQQVLKKHWGGSKIYGDIRELTTDAIRMWKLQSQGGKQEKWERTFYGIDILTAGVPCQPASIAGARRGEDDDRWLWPEAFRVVRETKPEWAVFENPCGILTLKQGLVFEKLLVEMESYGYEIQSVVIPACAVKAPHERYRVWVIAHSRHRNGQRPKNNGKRVNTNTEMQRLSKPGLKPEEQASSAKFRNKYYDWTNRWLEVATELCGVDDGLPCELDGFKLTKAGHRVGRLKALGNAIVPQVAIEIMRAIKVASLLTV